MCIVLLKSTSHSAKESLGNLFAIYGYDTLRARVCVCVTLFSETTKYKTLKIVRRLRSLRMILPLCVVSFIIKLSILFFIRFSQK